MIFRAKLKRVSNVFKEWRAGNRIAGTLHGVIFRWAPGGVYVTGVLDADQVAALRDNPIITLEATGAEPPSLPSGFEAPEFEIPAEPAEPAADRPRRGRPPKAW